MHSDAHSLRLSLACFHVKMQGRVHACMRADIPAVGSLGRPLYHSQGPREALYRSKMAS